MARFIRTLSGEYIHLDFINRVTKFTESAYELHLKDGRTVQAWRDDFDKATTVKPSLLAIGLGLIVAHELFCDRETS